MVSDIDHKKDLEFTQQQKKLMVKSQKGMNLQFRQKLRRRCSVGWTQEKVTTLKNKSLKVNAIWDWRAQQSPTKTKEVTMNP